MKLACLSYRYTHILPLLQFLLDGLLADKMLEHKRAHTLNLALDPSSELIWITMLLIQWYSLYLSRRRYQPKDEVDIQDLTTLCERCGYIQNIEYIKNILRIMHTVGTWNSIR